MIKYEQRTILEIQEEVQFAVLGGRGVLAICGFERTHSLFLNPLYPTKTLFFFFFQIAKKAVPRKTTFFCFIFRWVKKQREETKKSQRVRKKWLHLIFLYVATIFASIFFFFFVFRGSSILLFFHAISLLLKNEFQTPSLFHNQKKHWSSFKKKSRGKFQRFQFDRWRPRRNSKHEAFVLAEYSTGVFRQRRQSQTEKLLQKQKRQEREKKYLKWKRQSWKPKNDQHFCYFQLSHRKKKWLSSSQSTTSFLITHRKKHHGSHTKKQTCFNRSRAKRWQFMLDLVPIVLPQHPPRHCFLRQRQHRLASSTNHNFTKQHQESYSRTSPQPLSQDTATKAASDRQHMTNLSVVANRIEWQRDTQYPPPFRSQLTWLQLHHQAEGNEKK